MSSYDHELQSLIPVLNDLERTLAQQEAANDRGQMTGSIRRMTGNESGRRCGYMPWRLHYRPFHRAGDFCISTLRDFDILIISNIVKS